MCETEGSAPAQWVLASCSGACGIAVEGRELAGCGCSAAALKAAVRSTTWKSWTAAPWWVLGASAGVRASCGRYIVLLGGAGEDHREGGTWTDGYGAHRPQRWLAVLGALLLMMFPFAGAIAMRGNVAQRMPSRCRTGAFKSTRNDACNLDVLVAYG